MNDSRAPLTSERRQRILDRGQARVRRNRRITAAAVAAVLLAVAAPIAIASAHLTKDTVHTITRPTTTEALVVSPTIPDATTTTSLPRTATSTAVGPDSSASSTDPRNLIADATLKAELRAAFMANTRFAENEIAPLPVAGSVYYAYAPDSHTYWAIAEFSGTAAMTAKDGIAMQDGGDHGIFTSTDGHDWGLFAFAGVPFICPGVLPPNIERLWNLTVQSCGNRAEVPVGGPLGLVLGAEGYLYPSAWTFNPSRHVTGESEGSAVDPGSGARIDVVQTGSEVGAVNVYNPDHSPNYDGAVRGLPGCTIASWTKRSDGAYAFTCTPTPAGLQVEGVVIIHEWPVGARMLRVTMPVADHDVAQTILAFFRR